jgi:hypothetical protein
MLSRPKKLEMGQQLAKLLETLRGRWELGNKIQNAKHLQILQIDLGIFGGTHVKW